MLRKTISVILLLAIFTATAVTVEAQIVRNINAVEAYQLLQQRKDEVFLLDVRTPGEYFQVRLAGSRLIPISQLLQRINEVPRNRPILVYCEVGSRSAQVVGYFARNGFSEVYNLYGGINAWSRQGYPVLSGPP